MSAQTKITVHAVLDGKSFWCTEVSVVDGQDVNVNLDAVVSRLLQPVKQRQPLTDEQINDVYVDATGQYLRNSDFRLVYQFAHAIEAAHGIGGKV